MSDLVRARINGFEKNVGRAYAEANGFEVLDEPITNRDGSARGTTRTGGRVVKPKTSVAKAAAGKAAVTEPAPDKKGSDQ